MHFVISATYGPTDPTRAMLPFIFAASAVQSGDHVTLMLFAMPCSWRLRAPVPSWYQSARPTDMKRLRATDARGLTAEVLDKRIKLAGMNELHAAAKQPDARVVNF